MADAAAPDAGRSKEPLAASVARGLRDAIVSGELAAGSRVKQDQVAQQFGVSRSPVREAFRELAAQGFVVLERDVGARVTAMNRSELEQLYIAREALEPILVAETSRRVNASGLAEIRARLDDVERHARSGDIAAFNEHDGYFHRALLAASGLDLLVELATGLWQRTIRYRLTYTMGESHDDLKDRMATSSAEHELIFDAVAAGDADDAADLYRVHTRRTRIVMLRQAQLLTDSPIQAHKSPVERTTDVD